MYRASADPNVTTELHALDVSTAKGATAVGILAAFSLIFLVCLAVSSVFDVSGAGTLATIRAWVEEKSE